MQLKAVLNKLKQDIINRLQSRQKEFERYFSEINTFIIFMKLPKNPFIPEVKDVPEAIQEEFTELTNDSLGRNEFCSRLATWWGCGLKRSRATHDWVSMLYIF